MKIIIAIAILVVLAVATTSFAQVSVKEIPIEEKKFFATSEKLNSNQMEERIKDSGYYLIKRDKALEIVQTILQNLETPKRVLIASDPMILITAKRDSFGEIIKDVSEIEENEFTTDLLWIDMVVVNELIEGTVEVAK